MCCTSSEALLKRQAPLCFALFPAYFLCYISWYATLRARRACHEHSRQTSHVRPATEAIGTPSTKIFRPVSCVDYLSSRALHTYSTVHLWVISSRSSLIIHTYLGLRDDSQHRSLGSRNRSNQSYFDLDYSLVIHLSFIFHP